MIARCASSDETGGALGPYWRSGGFTLVELSVVIGVIVILVGLLTPVVALARRAAGQAQCASNLRQWAIAVNIYVAENDGWLPRRGQGKMPTETLSWYDDWFNALPPLLGQRAYRDLVSSGQMPHVGDNGIWICPQLDGSANSHGNLFGYAMNMALSVRNARLPHRIGKVGPASTMVFLADGPAGYCSTIPFVSTPAAPAPFNPVARHNGKVNIAFLDGHVGAYDARYVGCNVAGDPVHPDACNQPELRWYWYVPGPPPSPWPGP